MKLLGNTLIFLGSLVFTQSTLAVKIVQCEDEQGNITFQDRCPPGSKPVNQKEYSVKAGSAATASSEPGEPLVIYIVPNCDSCDQVKEFLMAKNIPYREIDVKSSYELQQELKEKTGGELLVPALIVGEKTLTGYSRSQMISALTEAGYIKQEEQE